MTIKNNKQLKIIAVNLLDGNRYFIKKNLQTNSPYFFYNGYQLIEPNKKGQFSIKETKSKNVSEGFFSYNLTQKPNISISAIVGKNGSGKSALIDIVLRLINNLAYKHIPYSKTYSTAAVKWVKGIRAQLYFSIGNDFYLVQQDGDDQKDIALYKMEVDLNNRLFGWHRQSSAMKTLGESFFYTILMNCSLYAFNTIEYKEEWENRDKEESCWLRGLFHKNDGYQTPAVLNPMRTKGNIDVNRENSLAKDRLISLFFNEKEERNLNFTEINNNTRIISLTIVPDEFNVQRKYNAITEDWGKNRAKNADLHFFENLKTIIITEWQAKYKFKPKYEKDREYDLATLYLVYKTISIAQTYDNQLSNSSCLMPINGQEWNSERLTELNKFISELDNESSHITFKLRQTLAFLVFRHFEVRKNELVIDIDNFGKLVGDKISPKWRYLDFVPAPFFSTEIMLKNKFNDEIYPFSRLSSGERQIIYSASSILYHIRNLNSIKGNLRRIKYGHINIILDEIELYFHPEFQRKYIDYLIKCITSINFQDIESINILMATHSPFILSDIPETNVLFLNEGKSQKGISETFGSNIHTLYKNNFFIEGMPIGEFAKNKINQMFDKVRNTKTTDTELYKIILLVGEPLLRSQLLKQYNQNSAGDIENRIKELETEIQTLKSKQNDKN